MQSRLWPLATRWSFAARPCLCASQSLRQRLTAPSRYNATAHRLDYGSTGPRRRSPFRPSRPSRAVTQGSCKGARRADLVYVSMTFAIPGALSAARLTLVCNSGMLASSQDPSVTEKFLWDSDTIGNSTGIQFIMLGTSATSHSRHRCVRIHIWSGQAFSAFHTL